ncbi:MAG: DUF6504 family protein [Candidatus Baltobacteraceae bacterium]
MSRRFVSEPLVPAQSAPAQAGEPQLPPAFTWRGQTLTVARVNNVWRSTKEDRGDVYLKRHWFEFETPQGCTATVYFDRAAKRGTPHWWLYAITAET